MLRRIDRVLPAGILSRLRARIHDWLRVGLYNGLRPRLHELLLGRIFELLRSGHLHNCLWRRLVSGLLGRSRSHTLVGFAEYLCRVLPNSVRSQLCTEHLRIMPVWLRSGLRTSEPVLELLKLFDMRFAM